MCVCVCHMILSRLHLRSFTLGKQRITSAACVDVLKTSSQLAVIFITRSAAAGFTAAYKPNYY